jgi:MSHA biogenesis protein MshP
MSQRRATGFALILAVFLIVTLAAIGVYLVTTSTAQVAAVTQDEQAARAYQAARTGLEIAAHQLLRPVTANCVTPDQFITLGQGLNGFFVNISCAQVNTVGETEGGTVIAVYRVTATGCNANPCTPATPASTYVERQLQITITR